MEPGVYQVNLCKMIWRKYEFVCLKYFGSPAEQRELFDT